MSPTNPRSLPPVEPAGETATPHPCFRLSSGAIGPYRPDELRLRLALANAASVSPQVLDRTLSRIGLGVLRKAADLLPDPNQPRDLVDDWLTLIREAEHVEAARERAAGRGAR